MNMTMLIVLMKFSEGLSNTVIAVIAPGGRGSPPRASLL